MIYNALINAGRGIRRERIRPTRRDSHGGRSDEFISRACIACRHYAIDSNTYEPFTHQEARGIDAPFKGLRVHSTHKGEETGGKHLSRKETTLLSMCAPHLRPLIALSQRFRSCTGASVLLKTPGAYTRARPPVSSHSRVGLKLGKHRPERAGGPPHRTGLPEASNRKAASALLA